ncbi:helix-turn-helix domain-containing protein [Nonomuraea bangladeshensis]|uniref:Helix-turn-helix domain-containing protein n=1 Tax=Nonomuraea bangladeshensis TaxID=404385 RepID=A0ABV3H5C9_9ACTN
MATTVTTTEIAAAAGVSLRTAQRWAQQGKVAAVKQHGRWIITVPAQLDDYKPHQIESARQAIEQRAILPSTRRPGMWTAVSSNGTTHYLVHANACTCAAGLKGRRCWHRAAVAILTAAAHRAA